MMWYFKIIQKLLNRWINLFRLRGEFSRELIGEVSMNRMNKSITSLFLNIKERNSINIKDRNSSRTLNQWSPWKNKSIPYEEIMWTINGSDGFLPEERFRILPRSRDLHQVPSSMRKGNKHQVVFICSMDDFKERSNRISTQNLSETAQNPPRFCETILWQHSVKVVPSHMRRKDRKLGNIAATHQLT